MTLQLSAEVLSGFPLPCKRAVPSTSHSGGRKRGGNSPALDRPQHSSGVYSPAALGLTTVYTRSVYDCWRGWMHGYGEGVSFRKQSGGPTAKAISTEEQGSGNF